MSELAEPELARCNNNKRFFKLLERMKCDLSEIHLPEPESDHNLCALPGKPYI